MTITVLFKCNVKRKTPTVMLFFTNVTGGEANVMGNNPNVMSRNYNVTGKNPIATCF